MNPITAAWIATIGHVACGVGLVILAVVIILRYEAHKR